MKKPGLGWRSASSAAIKVWYIDGFSRWGNKITLRQRNKRGCFATLRMTNIWL